MEVYLFNVLIRHISTKDFLFLATFFVDSLFKIQTKSCITTHSWLKRNSFLTLISFMHQNTTNILPKIQNKTNPQLTTNFIDSPVFMTYLDPSTAQTDYVLRTTILRHKCCWIIWMFGGLQLNSTSDYVVRSISIEINWWLDITDHCTLYTIDSKNSEQLFSEYVREYWR